MQMSCLIWCFVAERGFFGWLQTHSVVMVTFVDNDEPGRMQEGMTFTVGKCNVLTEAARRQPL